jgi:hypothetical protein
MEYDEDDYGDASSGMTPFTLVDWVGGVLRRRGRMPGNEGELHHASHLRGVRTSLSS